MDDLLLPLFAFAVGLTVLGVAGTLLEIAAGRRLSFAEPFVTRASVARSLAASALAGPYMLVNDALAAWRDGGVNAVQFATCLMLATGWVLAAGIVAIDLVLRLSALLS